MGSDLAEEEATFPSLLYSVAYKKKHMFSCNQTNA